MLAEPPHRRLPPMQVDWVAVSAIATVLAVVAALFIAIWGDWLKSLTSSPKLTLSISMKPPDCHRIQVIVQFPVQAAPLLNPGAMATPPLPLAFDAYYFRLSVGNDGGTVARNVGVRAVELARLDQASGTFTNDPHFMSMDLTWSHAGGGVVAAKIDPQLPKHCDLAQVNEADPTLLQFCTEVSPNEVAPGVFPTKKSAGVYRLRVAATADNSKPVYRILKIVYDGNWYQSEADMFTKGVLITVEAQTHHH